MQLNKVASSSGKVEQIFPGMLKNRGSNIRKWLMRFNNPRADVSIWAQFFIYFCYTS